MVLVLAVLAGLVLGRLLGGRVSALAAIPIHAPWLFYAAIGLQIAGYPSGVLPWSIGNSLATVLWMASYALLITAVAVNPRLPGAGIVGLGMLSNLAAVVANGGHMPAQTSTTAPTAISTSPSENTLPIGIQAGTGQRSISQGRLGCRATSLLLCTPL